MESIWTKINDRVPYYLKDIAERFNIKFVKVDSLCTAAVGKDFIILIFIDRFYVDVSYIRRDKNNQLVVFEAGNYFAEYFDQEDRKNLLIENHAADIIINELKVINHGLISKWSNVLEGDTKWLKNYRKSEWFDTRRLSQEEENILGKYI